MKGNFCFYFLFFILISQFAIINSLSPQEYELCTSIDLHNLEISTGSKEVDNLFDIPILQNCDVNKYWKVRGDHYTPNCVVPERVFEGEDIIRRPIRFNYLKSNSNSDKNRITVQQISILGDKKIADTTLTKTNFSLRPGEMRDIYIDYECTDMDTNKSVGSPWVTLTIIVQFDNKIEKRFEFTKICTATYKDQFDFSHLLIVICVFFVIYLSVKDFLRSNIEITVVEKFTEIKNVENLFIISICVFLLIVFFKYTGYFNPLTSVSTAIVGIFSMALIFEAIFRHFNVFQSLELSSYEIKYVGSITNFFLVCVGFAVLVYLLWYLSKFWIFNDVIAFSISLIAIRVIKFTSIKFLLLIFIGVYVYLLHWTVNYSNYIGEDYKLSNNSPIDDPIKILSPEFHTTPFSACTSISIADIILPGIYLMFLKKFDFENNIQSSVYFQSGIVGLIAGLGSKLIVYYVYSLPTPSFLYTAPFIIFISLILSFQRGESEKLLQGFVSTSYQNKTEEGIANAIRSTDLNQYDPIKMSPGQTGAPSGPNTFELKDMDKK